jgi:hypothetical protein
VVLWIQELLRIASPFLTGTLVPVIVLLVLAVLPYTLDRSPEGVARWLNRPGRPDRFPDHPVWYPDPHPAGHAALIGRVAGGNVASGGRAEGAGTARIGDGSSTD